MKRIVGYGGLALLVALPACGSCKKTGDVVAVAGHSTDGGAAVTGAASRPAPAIQAAGMEDPFARLAGNLPRRLNDGYKALRAKSWKAGRAEFEAVVAASPDYGSARFQVVRAAALDGDFDAAVREYGELLARDYVGYAGKLDKPKDMAPLRASPAWARVAEMDRVAQAACSAGLDKGVFFVARARDVGESKLDGETPLKLEQEAYFYDSAAARYRRLTDSGGRIYAINVSADRKTLAFLQVDKILAADGEGTLIDPRAGFVDLTTMKIVGPFKLDHTVQLVQIVFTPAGEPTWRTGEAEFVIDSTRSALVRSALGPDDHKAGGLTYADFDTVLHTDDAGGGLTLAPDGTRLEVAGSDTPIRSARPIDAATLAWSPGKKRLAYAGVLDACKVLSAPRPDKANANELFLWDREKKVASRVAQAISAFDSTWLDDDHLVYEGGVGRDGRLHVFEVPTRNDVTLKPRYGAGLYGYPTLKCELKRVDEAAAEEEQPEVEEPDGD